ncbi:unnamed protein product [Amoebophrya sp. A25]|nr:unnamed protein product [Amoebophrya sp. A25]|eukprot:GSA25T00016277001.1
MHKHRQRQHQRRRKRQKRETAAPVVDNSGARSREHTFSSVSHYYFQYFHAV